MTKETLGLARTVQRATERGREVRARASDIVDAAAERGRRAYDTAVNGTADVMATASDTVEAVGQKAHTAGTGIRRSTKRAARAMTRGEKNLRRSDPGDIVDAAAAAVRRHQVAFAVVGAAMLAFITVRIMRR